MYQWKKNLELNYQVNILKIEIFININIPRYNKN